MKNKQTISFLILLFTAIIWGGAYPVLDYVINLNEMSLSMINFMRFSIGGVALLPFVFLQFKKINKRDLCVSIISGLVLFFSFLFLTLSIADGTPGASAMLLNASIFIVPLLTAILDRKKPKWFIFVSTFIVFIGFIFILFKDGFHLPNGEFSVSILYAFISALLFSLQIFIMARFHKNTETSLCVTCIQLFVIALMFGLYILIFETSHMFVLTGTKSIIPLLFLGVLATGVAYYFQTKASLYLSENTCNIVLSLESFFANIISIIFGFDNFTWMFGLAMLIIIGGVALYTIFDIKSQSQQGATTQQYKKKNN